MKVTYFLVGEMARAYPDMVRRIYNAGHTIGTHSQDHPLGFQRLAEARVEREVDGGIASVDAALGDRSALAPFFRIPGLGRSKTAEDFLASRHLVTWSADVVADDWFRHISAQQIVETRDPAAGREGPRHSAAARHPPRHRDGLPTILKELKSRGYHVVQVVAAGEHPATLPETMVASPIPDKEAWPRILKTSVSSAAGDGPALRRHHRGKRTHTARHRPAKLAGVTEPDYNKLNRDWQLKQF